MIASRLSFSPSITTSFRRFLPSSTMSSASPSTSTARPVKNIFVAPAKLVGDGAIFRQSIGSAHMKNLDPFLLLDEFSSDKKGKGFGMHPHRGQQTVSYVLVGSINHEDNKGHTGTVHAGGLQYMTAGKGIVHSEKPGTANTRGLQLWINLAAKDKLCEPQYRYQSGRTSQREGDCRNLLWRHFGRVYRHTDKLLGRHSITRRRI